MNYKYLLVGGLVSALGLAAGYSVAYRMYLSEGTKTVLKQLDYKSAVEGYTLCKIHDYSTVNMPYEQCLDFFKYYVPDVFGKSKKGEFPLNFTKHQDFVKTYKLVQKNLGEFGKEKLSLLSELTHGQVKS
ncbi:MAG: hypothetical protein JKY14_09275 [Paraglaciecola sp.]|nr:hypothetical protein [Paraglaciecola sp.]